MCAGFGGETDMKRLIVCCDGTWNRADQERNGKPTPTNVIKIAYRIAKRDGDTPQVVYYDQGVGTGDGFDRLTGGAFGDGLEENINDAYRFLVANYEAGDEIYLFGFSRGAYTVRSLGGMVRKCGILRREFVEQYRRAIELYRSEVHPDDDAARLFRAQFAVGGVNGQRIKLIGVWDTVGALGIPLRGLRWLTRRKHQFHDTELSGIVEHGYHALAVDERRAPFKPTLWAAKAKPGQTVEQVWFCGAHSDVGGGYAEAGLSDIALEWMIAKARLAGLAFDDAAVAAHPIDPDPLGALHDSKTGLYRLTKGFDRPIGLAARAANEPESAARRDDPTQSPHPSVLRRWDSAPRYRPRSLAAYFRRSGDPRGDTAPGREPAIA